MSEEAVERPVNDTIAMTSAEDVAMMRVELREYAMSHGLEALYDRRLGGRSVSTKRRAARTA